MTKAEILDGLVWASEATTDSRANRDALIFLARKNGASVREIAASAGMSRQGVTKILSRGVTSVDNVIDKA